MCNCSSNPVNICNQCKQGNQCGCPPDYTITPQSVPCGCCPDGYTFFGPNANWSGGFCQSKDVNGSIVPPISCNDCTDTLSSDCIILPAIPCLGLSTGTLTSFAQFLCSTAFIETLLTTIGLNPILGSGFCQLVQNCPPVSSGTTPIIGSILITYP